jgi:hypothetical protein
MMGGGGSTSLAASPFAVSMPTTMLQTLLGTAPEQVANGRSPDVTHGEDGGHVIIASAAAAMQWIAEPSRASKPRNVSDQTWPPVMLMSALGRKRT